MSFESNNSSQEVEPTVSAVPLFQYKKLQFKNFPSASFSEIQDTLPKEDNPSFDNTLCKKSLSAPLLSKNTCPYTHILVADDDSFQHLYYKILFTSKSPIPTKLFNITKKYKVSLHFSGEELLERYSRVCQCLGTCSGVKLIIVDYQMGQDKLNGVEVCKILRERGYKGRLILRTSESKEYLEKKHEDFGVMIRDGTIDALVSKEFIEEGKKTIFEYLLGK